MPQVIKEFTSFVFNFIKAQIQLENTSCKIVNTNVKVISWKNVKSNENT